MRLIKYRIVRDRYLGYECQVWRLWWPFWCEMDFANTHRELEDAIMFIKKHGSVVWKSY